jgi:RHS repeat-associated protein
VTACEYQRYQAGARPFWTPLRFPGQYCDAETDLFENWNRHHDPGIGRYLQPEPDLQDPGAIQLYALRGHNLGAYAYALDNPVHFIDPTGLDPWSGDAVMESMLQMDGTLAPQHASAMSAGYGAGVGFGLAARVGLNRGQGALSAICVGTRRVWNNLSIDGPRKSLLYGNGRIFGVRWKGAQAGFRLDLHPLEPRGNPILHINYGALWDPVEWWNRP